jgi:hypothetical protein
MGKLHAKEIIIVSILCSIMELTGCSASSVIIYKAVIKPKEIKDTLKAVEQLRIINNGKLFKFEKFYKVLSFVIL